MTRIESCYVCEQRAPCQREPVWPVRLRGKAIAPICRHCHDAIARGWSEETLGQQGQTGLIELMKHFGLAWLAELGSLGEGRGHQAAAADKLLELLLNWSGLSPAARIVGSCLVRRLLELHAPWKREPAFVIEFCWGCMLADRSA
jgi:hypothetical protein